MMQSLDCATFLQEHRHPVVDFALREFNDRRLLASRQWSIKSGAVTVILISFFAILSCPTVAASPVSHCWQRAD